MLDTVIAVREITQKFRKQILRRCQIFVALLNGIDFHKNIIYLNFAINIRNKLNMEVVSIEPNENSELR